MPPDTEAAIALRAINVKPAQIAELAQVPLRTIETAIADGRARPGVRDLAGWVVSLLRTHREHGWRISPPTPAPDSPEALRDAFARYAAKQEAELRTFHMDDEQSIAELAPEPADSPINISELWDTVLAAMQAQLPRAEFNTWIRCCTLLSITDEIAVIRTPSATVKESIERCYAGMLCAVITMLIGSSIRLRIVIGQQDAAVRPDSAQRLVPTIRSDRLQGIAPICAPVQSTTSSEVAQRPDWITAESWATLPAMLRAALLGSTLRDGKVRAISPYLDQLIATRYAPEVAALIADAAPLVSLGKAMPEP